MKNQKYYLGLDIGTDSVGYAVTNEQYDLLKFHGSDAWGSHIFEEASSNQDRRAFRSARRRLDRRQQRVRLIREIFAPEIAKKDERFFIRLDESMLYRDDCGDKYVFFNDEDYTDKDYFRQYPTIHHLIVDLMKNDSPHDARLVYLACAWLVSHRGHFINNISKENVAEIKDFGSVYSSFLAYFTDNGYRLPWEGEDVGALSSALRKRSGVNAKNKELVDILCGGKKPAKLSEGDEIDEEFPFSLEGIIKLLAGGTYSLKSLFGKEEYDNLENKSVSLGMDDEKLAEVMSDIGEDYDLIAALRSVYDWTLLVDALGSSATVSEAKVAVYEQHAEDLALLKKAIKKYAPEKYNEVFRKTDKDNNYAAYSYHTDEKDVSNFKKCKDIDEFSKYLLGILGKITPDPEDEAEFNAMKQRLDDRTFLPKQKNTDNRVIPHQLYWYELHLILQNAGGYLGFLNEKDESGFTGAEKIESVFLFRVPYYVGPLNKNSANSWLERKAGKIYPWNFDEMVDRDASEENFIKKMTNTCTYLPDKNVLPKDSLVYHKFTVLNEINNIRINGERISVELKQNIYNDLFMKFKKVTRKKLINYLVENNYIQKGEDDSVTGIDAVTDIKSNLAPQISFRRLLESGALTEDDAERIIERASYAEDKSRLSKWIEREYPHISAEDRKYICSIKMKDFGRLSREFLCSLTGIDLVSGECTTVLAALWNSQNNLMEIIEDESKYTFKSVIADYRSDYYAQEHQTLEARMKEMYLSNSVKRAVYRTLDVVSDVEKAFGKPEKIFVEMTRGGDPDGKGKRTKSRKEQILELYDKCEQEDVKILRRQLEEMGEEADRKLRGEKLFLYYVQLGRSMYSDRHIDLSQLGNSEYCDIDHIYPQAFVKDDSVINNKVLVFSEENGNKSNIYPIDEDIRHSMRGFWSTLKEKGLISEEKYKRLVRSTPFTEEEKRNFINRQITETSQSTKAVAALLKEHFPDAEIVYSKARLTSEFRDEFNIYKSRTFNDLHHAVDAYLNIVAGNVYNSKFTKNFRVDKDYSIKVSSLFTHPVVCGGVTVWDGEPMLDKVKKTAVRNTAHFTKYSYVKREGFFKQTRYKASDGLIPLKKGLPTEKYGGYNTASVMCYLPVKFSKGKKTEIMIMPVELLAGDRIFSDKEYAAEYAKDRIGRITGKAVTEVSFPLGMRPWKVNTVLSLDGFRVCISGSKSGGTRLIMQSLTQFSAGNEWKFYLQKLEKLDKHMKENKNYVFDSKYDNISAEKNIELYDLYIDKLENSIYKKRINSPANILKDGREKFIALDEPTQAKTLLNIHQVFGRVANGTDLTAIGGSKGSAGTEASNCISNWSRLYKDVRVIDSSPSGLWEKKSCNLLELL